ncbi:metal-sulfur cluster assembly factor [Corynebacterium silvaticum]|uniref:Metal-sulfur cluster assembly factor n=1 Tax=Corynebacterium silvaticum TaxID=2320431 RepID=A0A7Y4P8N8_9CORY|nr:metal-sulfur cluster assembly factor [Corynebacterium silvaticum]ARU46191.1 metal-sulfur cluster assembly factor [Corynebacterium silvaticum]MBH5299305.1 metal-sulfur cluster assembly factor [Corynebacterium silvaticum]NOM64375.1 metal-sulfur cluster assembly factor [Corynebacterium silvaticum]NON69584.1 metal-sulfur cluster assembly factor [Corynebacterium silvaticum]TFA94203.1 metal-sulfur cluster assembly factor [Corynebacterium silvaticum]
MNEEHVENKATQDPTDAQADTPVESQSEDLSEGTATEATSEEQSDLAAGALRPEQSENDIAKASDVEEYLRDVIDPELGINVVDLGLVYDVWMVDGVHAHVNMTLTSPACPLTDVLEDQAQSAVVGNKIADSLSIHWVWMPPWGPHMITEDGRDQLRALGFSV